MFSRFLQCYQERCSRYGDGSVQASLASFALVRRLRFPFGIGYRGRSKLGLGGQRNLSIFSCTKYGIGYQGRTFLAPGGHTVQRNVVFQCVRPPRMEETTANVHQLFRRHHPLRHGWRGTAEHLPTAVRLPPASGPVSYTHLTLPTIYSV